uniref:Tick transposon n=1 Tax=Rhipicephalus appendiculatus TaxID=34631 RepID=A0A131YQI8_RHIAP
MSWQHHMTFICFKLRRVACLLFNIKGLAPFPVRKMIVHALAYSVLRYGITIFAFCSERWKALIDSLLRSILKCVAYGSKLDTKTIFHYLGFCMFQDLFTRTVILRHDWSDDFKVPYVARRPLREQKRFTVPRSSTRYGEACKKRAEVYTFLRSSMNYLKSFFFFRLRQKST